MARDPIANSAAGTIRRIVRTRRRQPAGHPRTAAGRFSICRRWAGTAQSSSGSAVVDLISSIDKSAVTLWMRTSEISAW